MTPGRTHVWLLLCHEQTRCCSIILYMTTVSSHKRIVAYRMQQTKAARLYDMTFS